MSSKNTRTCHRSSGRKISFIKDLGTLLIFTPIPLVPKKCGLSISLYVCVQRRIRECPTLTYKPFHSLTKTLYVSLLITDYLIELAFLGHSNWDLVYDLEWDQKGTNKTLAPMGFGLWAFLSTLDKSKVTINYN